MNPTPVSTSRITGAAERPNAALKRPMTQTSVSTRMKCEAVMKVAMPKARKLMRPEMSASSVRCRSGVAARTRGVRLRRRTMCAARRPESRWASHAHR